MSGVYAGIGGDFLANGRDQHFEKGPVQAERRGRLQLDGKSYLVSDALAT